MANPSALKNLLAAFPDSYPSAPRVFGRRRSPGRRYVKAHFVLLAAMLCAAPAHAQPADAKPPLRDSVFATDSASRHSRTWAASPSTDDKEIVRRRTWEIIAANSVGVALYGKSKWWSDGFRSTFSTTSEGWFGQHTYSGGADKLGHFFMNYASARVFSRVFEWAGNDAEDARHTAAWMTLATFTAVEVLDGFSRNWRFSKEDVVMNLAGVGAALLLEHQRGLDDAVDLRFLYQPSRESGKGFDPFGDYSGQTYLLVLKGDAFPSWRAHPLLRYIEFAAGYGTRGYGGPASDSGSRHVFVGISLNLSRVIDDAADQRGAKHAQSRAVARTFLELVQVPGTIALERHTLGK